MEGVGPSSLGWEIIKMIITNVISLLVFIFYMSRQLAKQTEQIKALHEWMKQHEAQDDKRFDDSKNSLTKESGRFEKLLDTHITDSKQAYQNTTRQLETINNGLTIARENIAKVAARTSP